MEADTVRPLSKEDTMHRFFRRHPVATAKIAVLALSIILAFIFAGLRLFFCA